LPTASLLQTPGARANAATWCDESGHVWLFGGEGYDDNTASTQPKLLNDLWLFNTSRLEWNAMHNGGRQYTLSTNKESTKLLKAEAYQNRTNVAPKPRKKASSCGVPGIVFVIFGGIDSNGTSMSDTWIYLIQKSRWLLLSGNVSQLVEPQTPWYTNTSWCHLDALYVVGYGAGDVMEMWKFSLRTLKWSNKSLYLTEQPHCINYSLPIARYPAIDSIRLVWNGTFYVYQWWMVCTVNASNLLTLSVDVQRWNSLPFAKFMSNWHSTPVLWSDLNSICSYPAIFQQSYDCGSGNGQLCNLHRSYQIKSSTSWNEQRHDTSSWFYGDDMYIFGGQAAVDNSRTFFNDMYIIKQSDISADSTYFMFVLGSVIVLVAFVLLGFIVFCILRYCDYHRGRKKSGELRIRYMPLQDLSPYE